MKTKLFVFPIFIIFVCFIGCVSTENVPQKKTLEDFVKEAEVEAPFDLNAKAPEDEVFKLSLTDFYNLRKWDGFYFYGKEALKVSRLMNDTYHYGSSDDDYIRALDNQWKNAVYAYIAPKYKEFVEAENKKKQAEEQVRKEKNAYNPADFYVVPNSFAPADFTEKDLFDAVVAGKRMSDTQEALGGYYFVSDVVFVTQSGTNAIFRSADNAISQNMKIDSRSGLKGGEKVSLYYRIKGHGPFDYYVVAIKKH